MAERDDDKVDAERDDDKVDISDTTAPSVGPHTVIEKDDPEERLARHEQSETDAMGLDKRRQVIGGQYSATLTRQIVTYAVFLALLAAAVFGLKLLADDLDQPPKKVADEAPWTGTERKPTELQ